MPGVLQHHLFNNGRLSDPVPLVFRGKHRRGDYLHVSYLSSPGWRKSATLAVLTGLQLTERTPAPLRSRTMPAPPPLFIALLMACAAHIIAHSNCRYCANPRGLSILLPRRAGMHGHFSYLKLACTLPTYVGTEADAESKEQGQFWHKY